MTDSIGARLVLTERDDLLSILRSRAAEDFDRPTILPGWSVRDVLAHCGAALTMAGSSTAHGFSPEENQRDVDTRRMWPMQVVLDELSDGYDMAAAVIAVDPRLDGLALGEWLHGGDVRDALGVTGAYESAGLPDALALFEQLSRHPRYAMPQTTAQLPDVTLNLGSEPAEATLRADAATFVRLLGGRSPDPARFSLVGAEPDRYVVFR